MGQILLMKVWKSQERTNKSFPPVSVHKTQPKPSLATSYLHIRQDLTDAGSSALFHSYFHAKGTGAYVPHESPVWPCAGFDGQEYKIWGHVITLIGRFSEKLYCSAAFRESTEKQHKREHGVRLPWSVSTSVHFHCFTEVFFEISLTHQTYLTALMENNL